VKLPAIEIQQKWFVAAGLVLLSGIALAGVIETIYAAWLFHDLPDATELADYRPATATRVFAADGTLIGEYSEERRIYVSYDQIPTPVVQAFLAAEDRNFFQHGGIDVSGIGRAMAKNVFNVLTGRRLEGGSTITQQVAKNVLLTSESSLNRKLKEAILASRLEATLTKEQILELYLNEIFLGYRSYGVASAAFNYFGKSLSQLIDAGEIDATIGTHLPDSRKTNPDVQRIFPNFREVEREYYRKTGIFPVMHLIAIKREVYEKNPSIAKSLYDAFEKSKRAALVRMRNYSALRYMIPWLPDEIDEMERVFGDDQWTYGVEANRSTFETMMKFMVQQDMLKKAPTVEELFVKVD